MVTPMIAAPPLTPPPAAKPAGDRDYLSFSAIQACPLRYSFRYIAGLPEKSVSTRSSAPQFTERSSITSANCLLVVTVQLPTTCWLCTRPNGQIAEQRRADDKDRVLDRPDAVARIPLPVRPGCPNAGARFVKAMVPIEGLRRIASDVAVARQRQVAIAIPLCRGCVAGQHVQHPQHLRQSTVRCQGGAIAAFVVR